MAKETRRIAFEEFSHNLERVFQWVIRKRGRVVVETTEGEVAILTPLTRSGRKKTEADYEAFRAAAGGWQEVDTDKLLEHIYESRSLS